MAVIQKRRGKKGMSYRVLVRIKGQTVTQTFHDKDKARKWGYEMEDNIRSGKAPQIEAAKQTLDSLILAFSKNASRANLRTAHRVVETLEEWAKRLGGNRAVGAITTAMIQAELTKMLEDDGLAPGTVNRKRSSLSIFYKSLIKRGILDKNPVTLTDQQPEPRGRVRYLSDDERARLFAACKVQSETTCPMLYPLVVVACYSGMRQGELMDLDWTDVDLTTGQAIVQRSKNGDRRAAAIQGPALEALKEWRLRGVASIGRKRIFMGAFPRNAWARALKAAGVTDFHFHDLRHTAASYMAMSGSSVVELQAFLGHRSLEMVVRYGHLSPAHMMSKVSAMAERFR
jgi:integrase